MSIFIGGDTTEIPYNFSTKVAGSMTECPMKCYYADSPELLFPNDTKWIEFTQEEYDKLKKLDNIVSPNGGYGVGEKGQFLIELDLNGLCNSLYGGSNTVLKNSIKEIKAYTWAMGSGDNGGNIGYKGVSRMWVPTGGYWTLDSWLDKGTAFNYSDKIENMYSHSSEVRNLITNNNKIYILISSGYPASGTIPSKVFLDYINIKLELVRQRDKIDPIDIELGEEWSVLLKGVAIYPQSLEANQSIINIANSYGRFSFYRQGTNKLLRLWESYNSLLSAETITTEANKFQVCNILIIKKDNMITGYIAKNKDNNIYKASIRTSLTKGLYKLYLGRASMDLEYSDSFIEDIQVLNNKTFKDEEIELMLKGRNEIDQNNNYYNKLAEKYKNPNICPPLDNFYVRGYNSATVELKDNKLFIQNNSSQSNSEEQYVFSSHFQLMPNNRYELQVNCESIGNCEVFILNSKTQFGLSILNGKKLTTGINKFVFTTTETNCPLDSQHIRFDVNTWDSKLIVNSIELRRLD
ncbi:hypothetical protein [Clostridium sp. Marseille-Q2269]|uniref:hypothetical protein n=1 Tax=Clostridium sp. Marseille-Q2269 TaxID=2942205 RepID=UPI0020745330|nr:hypothetical protein [Clostridium sp. Marseille-Q2269]